MAVLPPLAYAPDGVDQAAWDSACAALRTYCGWHVAPTVTQDMTLDGPGTYELLLPTMHLTDLVSVTEGGAAVTSPEWSAKGLVRKGGYPYRWSDRYRSIVVSMTHGFDECPGELIGVLTEAASRGVGGSVFSQVGQVRYAGSSATPGSASFLIEQKAILSAYRIPQIS